MGVPRLKPTEAVEYSVPRPLDSDADAPARASWQSRSGVQPRPSLHEVQIGHSAERALDRLRRGTPVVRMGKVLAIQARVVERQDHAIEKDLVDLPRQLEVAPSFRAAVEIHRPAQTTQRSIQDALDDLSAYEGSSALVALATVKRGLVVADPASISFSRESTPHLIPLSDDRIRHFTMEQAKGFEAEEDGDDSAMEGGAAAGGLKRKGAAFTPDGAAAAPAAQPVIAASVISSSSGSVGSSDSAGSGSKRSKSSKCSAISAAPGQPRRRTKIPPSAVEALESWFTAHVSKPYPSEPEKAQLMQSTGLDIVQLNNWFTNTRKRRWVQHPSDPTQNLLTAIRIDKGGAGDAPMKPKVKRAPKGAATKSKVKKEESDEEEEDEVDGSSGSEVEA